MAYSRYLAQGERIVLQIHHHVMVLARPFFVALGAIVLSMVLGFLLSPADRSDPLDTVLGLVTLFFFLRFAWQVWEWRLDTIIVSDRRILEVSGLLTRKVATMPLEKLTDLTYHRSLLGRLLGYGRLSVESAGQEQGLSTLDYLASPDDFYRTVTELVTDVMARPDPGTVHEAAWDEEDTGPLPQVIV